MQQPTHHPAQEVDWTAHVEHIKEDLTPRPPRDLRDPPALDYGVTPITVNTLTIEDLLDPKRGPAAEGPVNWTKYSESELRAVRKVKAEQVTMIHREIERLKDGLATGTLDPDSVGGRMFKLNDAREALGNQLAAIRRALKRHVQAPASEDAGRPLAKMKNAELVAYAEELDDDVRTLKEELADTRKLRAIALGELGRRKIEWRAKH